MVVVDSESCWLAESASAKECAVWLALILIQVNYKCESLAFRIVLVLFQASAMKKCCFLNTPWRILSLRHLTIAPVYWLGAMMLDKHWILVRTPEERRDTITFCLMYINMQAVPA